MQSDAEVPPPTAPTTEPGGGAGSEPRPRRSRGGRGRGERREGETPRIPTDGALEPQDWKPGEGRRRAPEGEAKAPEAPREGAAPEARRERSPGGERRERPSGGGSGDRREGPGRDRDRGGRPGGREGGREGGDRGGRPRGEGDRGRGRGPRDGVDKPQGADVKGPATPAVPAKPDDFLTELGGELLQSVSRSFYLTITLLPESLRAPISLGYLLARTMDTIADATPAGKASERLPHLRAFSTMIKFGPDAEALSKLRRDITAKLPAGDEKKLLEQAARSIAWLESMPRDDKWELRRVLTRIAHGQELDLVRFGDGGELKSLATVGELDDYTYFVAGSVGEFWTRMCAAKLGAFSSLSAKAMEPLGKRYGQGLQLINILRDLPEDLAAGRCYLPADELAAAGIAPEDLTKHPAKARALVAKWRSEAIARLDDGWKYVQAIQDWKLRYPVSLPILIGLDTLALLASQPPLEQKTKVKVKRAATASTLLKAKLGVISQAWLDSMYSRRRKRAGK